MMHGKKNEIIGKGHSITCHRMHRGVKLYLLSLLS